MRDQRAAGVRARVRGFARLTLTGLAVVAAWQCSSGSPGGSASSSGAADSNAHGSGASGASAATGPSSAGPTGSMSGSAGTDAGAPAVDSGGGGSQTSSSSDSASAGSSQGASSAGASSGSSSGGTSSGATGSDAGTSGSGSAKFNPPRPVLTGVRGVTATDVQSINLHNAGTAPWQVLTLALGGANQALFQISGAPPLPTTLMAGADLPLTLTLLAASASMPAAPPQDSGSVLLTATLTATTSAGAAQADVYGLALTSTIWEPTLGQILTTLGYKLNVGLAQNNANPNRGKTAQQLPGVEPGTDEVAAPLFVKTGTASVTMSVAARFSPKGILPYGWYASGKSTTHNVVGTMDEITDPQTSNKARMVWPPLASGSATSFDPGPGPFGIWVYSDELTQKYDTGTASNGDYDYSQDALNSPANVHRCKAYPLKDATGTPVPNTYLIAVEEATNGDYQDYVFVLGNVSVAP